MSDEPKATHTGKLVRGEQQGMVRGFLVDVMGSRIEFDGTLDPRGGGYLLVGRVVHMPEYLHQPAIDGGE
jgi:hypothetical protein